MRHVAFVSVLALAAGANAQIYGGSNLINNSDLNTLAGWLGEGPLQIQNIFDHTDGDGQDASAFHAAADGKGRTFTVVRDYATGNIYGGYNPQSWNSYEGYHYASDGWLFNLTQGVQQTQQYVYQTYNASNYGPTFGGGHDIYIDNNLSYSYANAHTYGNGSTNILGQPGFTQVNLSDIEVFTIGVPAPGAGALLGIGGLIAARRRRA